MSTLSTVGSRFSQLIQHLGISKNAFAISLNKTATVIQHLVDERNKPGYDLLCKVFEVYPQVSKDWLLLGQGPMLTTASETVVKPTHGTTLLPTASPALAPEAVATPEIPAPKDSLTTEAILPHLRNAVEQAPSSPVLSATPEARATANETSGPTHTHPEALLTAALHAQHLQHQLALAEQRNQHLLEQQRLMQQLLDLASRR